jgi:hypothetical protein
MGKVVQENFYEAFLNDDDEIMFAIASRESEPEKPQLIYDGGEHAILYRNKGNTIVMDFLHPDIRPYLSKAQTILISEVNETEVVREYEVFKKQVKNIPLSENSVKAPNFEIDEELLKREN